MVQAKFSDQAIDLMSRVFANGLGDWGLISGQVIPKAQKWYLMLLCLTLSIIRLGSRVRSRHPLHLGVVAIEKEPSGQPRLRSPTLLLLR